MPIKNKTCDLLGDKIVFHSDFSLNSRRSTQVLYHPKKQLSSKVVLRAAGDEDMSYAKAERDVLLSLKSIKDINVSIAKPVNDDEDIAEFFKFILNPQSDFWHFFCHCNHLIDESKFHITISNKKNLSTLDFIKHAGPAGGRAISVLNVCNAAPNPSSLNSSFVEYFLKQQNCPIAVATLFPVRSDDAVAFTREFYSELIPVGLGLERSVSQTLHIIRSKLLSQGGSLSAHLYRTYGPIQTSHLSVFH